MSTYISSLDEGDVAWLVETGIARLAQKHHDHPTIDRFFLRAIQELVREQSERGAWPEDWRDRQGNTAAVEVRAVQFNDGSFAGALRALRQYAKIHDKWVDFGLVSDRYLGKVTDSLDLAWRFVRHVVLKSNGYVAMPPCVSHGGGHSTSGRKKLEPEGVYDLQATSTIIDEARRAMEDPLVHADTRFHAKQVDYICTKYLTQVLMHYQSEPMLAKTDVNDWTGSPVITMPKVKPDDTLPRFTFIGRDIFAYHHPDTWDGTKGIHPSGKWFTG